VILKKDRKGRPDGHRVTTVVFDYNGVLIDDLEFLEEAYFLAGAEMGFDLTREKVKRFISHTPEDKRTLYFGDISNTTWKKVQDLKNHYYFGFAKQGNLLFPDAEEVLTALSRKYSLGLVSNNFRAYFEMTFPPHLAGLFKATLFSEEVDKPKPSPEPLFGVLKSLGAGVDQCCYVGDSVVDVDMARNAGVRVLALTTGYNTRSELLKAGADAILDSLKDLPPGLEAMQCAEPAPQARQ
jgi:HAD superfamily hydrolase (TIGR01549 family)